MNRYRQVTGYLELVQLFGYLSQCQQPLDLGCEREQSPWRMEVEQRLYAEMVARTEKLPTFPIPDREGEIPQKMLGAPGSPTLVRGQDQIGIGDLRGRSTIEPQRPNQLLAIVDAGVRGHDQVAVASHEGLPLQERFGSRMEHQVPESHRPLGPHRGAVRTPVRHGFGHSLKSDRFDIAAIQPPEPDDAAQLDTLTLKSPVPDNSRMAVTVGSPFPRRPS